MSVSSEIKGYLSSTDIKRSECCKNAFKEGVLGKALSEQCPSCINHYLAGYFVGSGTMTDPLKDFHLDIKVAPEMANHLTELLMNEGLEPRSCPTRGSRIRLYYKGSSKISDFLTFIGASKYALEVMEHEVMKNVRSKENRKANAELANVDRAATAAAEQIRAIKKLKKHGALHSLPEELVKTAKIREENPFMSLTELCGMFSPPISKSGLSHRLKRLLAEADGIKDSKQ